VQEEKKLLDMSMKESKRQRDERTPSEKLQDEIEPIPSYPCPMHEDYDDEEDYKIADHYDEVNDIEKRRKDK
jgi:protein subunit release factor B